MVLAKLNENKSIQEFVLVSKAPVETAVKLSKQFRILATKEKERARDILLAGEFAAFRSHYKCLLLYMYDS